MDFYTTYRNNRRLTAALTRHGLSEDFLLVPAADPVPFLYPHGILRTGSTQPWRAEFSPLPGYRLLRTLEGSGEISVDGQTVSCQKDSLLFFPLDRPHTLTASSSGWSCSSLFLDGPAADYYYQRFYTLTASSLTLSRQSGIPLLWDDLFSRLPHSLDDPLWQISALTKLLTELIREASRQDVPPVQSYLLAIRKELHDHYQQHVSLDDLERRFHISKFRIAREFTAAFGKPPITWLNERRMEAAARLLLQTDSRVNEIGSMVGIDNTNHFINLFHRQYSVTPGEYRRLHS
ncbi:MAG: helix-turn-helix domain-containing protein [Lachnospiraceae bacterium]|nr:helix-turn-helix domain-containing protein [Lachnospiraceae bacterium]